MSGDDDLEALFAAPALGESPIPESRIVALDLLIEGEKYTWVLALPAGFPERYADESEGIAEAALAIARIATTTFIAHFEGRQA